MKKIDEKDIYEIKYYEGFVDGVQSVSHIWHVFIEELQKIFQRKGNTKDIMQLAYFASNAIKDIVFKAIGNCNQLFSNLDEKYGLEYDKETEVPVYDHEEKVIKIEKIQEKIQQPKNKN